MGQDDGHGARSSRPWLADALDPWRTSAPWPTCRPSAAALPRIWPTGSWPGATVRTVRRRVAPEAGAPGPVPPGRGRGAVARRRGAGRRSVDWLVEHAVSLVGILIERLPRRSRTDAAPLQVDLPPWSPGGESSAVFWVHNTSAAVVEAVRPHCAAPRSHLAGNWPPTPSRSTRRSSIRSRPGARAGIEVRVRVAPDVEPGLYVSVADGVECARSVPAAAGGGPRRRAAGVSTSPTAPTAPSNLARLLALCRQRIAAEIERRLPRGEPHRWLYDPWRTTRSGPGRRYEPRSAWPAATPSGAPRTTR